MEMIWNQLTRACFDVLDHKLAGMTQELEEKLSQDIQTSRPEARRQ
jgi:hypothetical protein